MHDEVEVTASAESAWIELLLSVGGRMIGSPDCTLGYYNNEVQDDGPMAALAVGYPIGAPAHFRRVRRT
jgi:cyclohexanone monooxygenase